MNHDGFKRVRFRYRGEIIEPQLVEEFFDVFEDFVGDSGLIELDAVELSEHGLRLVISGCGVLTLSPRDNDWREKWKGYEGVEDGISGVAALDAFRAIETTTVHRSRGKRGSGKRDQVLKDMLVAKVITEWHRLQDAREVPFGLRTAVANIAARADLPVPSNWTHPATDNVIFENTLLQTVKRELAAEKAAASN